MPFNSSQMIHQLREDFERLLVFVTGSEAQTATMDQMERSLFRQVLHMGYQLLRLFVMKRTEIRIACAAGETRPDCVAVSFAKSEGLLFDLWQTEF